MKNTIKEAFEAAENKTYFDHIAECDHEFTKEDLMDYTRKPIRCTMISGYERERQIRELEEKYYEIQEENFIPTYKLAKWDKKPFIRDRGVFKQDNFEMLFNDDFLSLNDDKRMGHQKALDAGRITIAKYLEREALLKEKGIRTSKKWTDDTYNWVLGKKLESAIPQEPGIADIGEEEGNYMAATSMGEKSPASIKFDDGEIQERTPVTYGQLSLMIAQDCNGDGSEIKILQLPGKGRCSIPSHYRIEEIQARAKVTLWQASQISKMYRILELPFEIVKLINNKLANREYGITPWDVTLKGGKSLLQLAQGIKAVMLAPQEDPEWAKVSEDSFGYRIIDSTAANYNSDFCYKDYNTHRESQWEQTNNVNELTYWRLSNIPANKSLAGSKKRTRQFEKALDKLGNFKLNPVKIKAVTNWIKKYCSKAQKDRWTAEVRRISQIRASRKIENNKIKIIPARLEEKQAA